MRTRLFLGVAVMVALGAGTFSARLHRATIGAKTQLQQIQRRRAVEIEAARQQLAAAKSTHVELERATSMLARAAEQANSRAAAPRDPLRTPRTAEEHAAVTEKRAAVLRHDPLLQLAYAKRTRGFVLQQYGPFFTAAKIPADVIDRFLAAAVQYSLQLVDLNGAAAEQGPASRAAVDALARKAAEDREQAYRAILGEPAYQALQEYQRAGPVRALVGRLAGTAVRNGVPLSPGQADAVVAAIVRASPQYCAGGVAAVASVNWNAVDPQLRQLLTPLHLAMLSADVGQDRLEAAVRQAISSEKPARPSGAVGSGG